ncbi:MAG: VOC family protein [Gemmatimonadales bacterium]|jgi:catechol 2,3-dioxygenase-like lactoylglutathione lyase family enzyme
MNKLGVSTVVAGCLALSGCGEGGGGRVELGTRGAELLGAGHGLDHVVIAVRDLEASRNFFVDSLGFARAPRAQFPGVANTELWFSDTTYLELITVTDREQAMGFMPQLPEFLDRHERGAMYLGLDVASAAHAAGYLRERGFEMMGPLPGSAALEGLAEPVPDMWHYVMFTQPVVPANALFFIEYDRAVLDVLAQRHPELAPQRYMSHPNTALGIRAVWIAVNDLSAAATAFESVGLPAGPVLERNFFTDRVRKIETGHGDILLLEPTEEDGFTARFMATRGEGIMGVSLRVASLARAREVMAPDIGRRLMPHAGFYGGAFLVQPPLTQGLWIEFFEERG